MAKIEFAPFGKCPVCKKPLWPEMVGIGLRKPDDEGHQKPKVNFFAILGQIIDFAIDQSLRAAATAASEGTASGVTENRETLYCCNNDNCPLNYAKGQMMGQKYYFKPAAPGVFETQGLVGDVSGLIVGAAKAMYKPPKEKPKGGGGGGQQQEEPEEEEEPQEEEGAPEEEQDEGGEEEEEE